MTVDEQLRLHVWALFETYGDAESVAAAACVHGGHGTAQDTWACMTAAVLADFLRAAGNRQAVLAAMGVAEERN